MIERIMMIAIGYLDFELFTISPLKFIQINAIAAATSSGQF